MNEQLSLFEKDLTSQADSGTVLNERTNERTNDTVRALSV